MSEKYERYIHKHIELCTKCEGEGIRYIFAKYDLLHQEPIRITCEVCEGSGRVYVSKKTEITVEAFK
jgi:DnaJ-class molecular chaperone